MTPLRFSSLIAALLIGGVAVPTSTFAQGTAVPPTSDMVDSFAKARTALLAAIEAAGGQATLRGITGLSYTLEGDVFNDIQGYSAAHIGRPERDSHQRIISRFDIRGLRFAQDVTQRAPSGYDSQFGQMWAGGTQFATRAIPREYSRSDNAPSPYAAAGAYMVSARWLPPIILGRAAQNMRSAIWVGDGEVEGQAADIVDVSFDEQVRFRLTITRTEHRVRRVETLAPDPVTGDDTSIAILSGDQVIGGVHFPTRVVAHRRGFANQDFALGDVALNPAFTDTDFAPPADYRQITLPPAPPRAHLVAGRVYEVRALAGGTYQVPFVVMDDFVVAYEAPLGIAATRQVIAEIRRIAPDKPIRYVVVSHFHADHAGGVGAYAEIGATILSSAENRDVLQAYAANNRSRLQGQDGPCTDIAIAFEAVPASGRRIVDSGGHRLDIIDFAGVSHVEHMLALFDADSGVFMGADHHISAVAWNPTFARTADWIRRHTRAAIILEVHDGPMTRTALLTRAESE